MLYIFYSESLLDLLSLLVRFLVEAPAVCKVVHGHVGTQLLVRRKVLVGPNNGSARREKVVLEPQEYAGESSRLCRGIYLDSLGGISHPVAGLVVHLRIDHGGDKGLAS